MSPGFFHGKSPPHAVTVCGRLRDGFSSQPRRWRLPPPCAPWRSRVCRRCRPKHRAFARAFPAAYGGLLDLQCRWRDAPTAFHDGFAEIHGMVGLRQLAPHAIGDLAAAQPPLGSDFSASPLSPCAASPRSVRPNAALCFSSSLMCARSLRMSVINASYFIYQAARDGICIDSKQCRAHRRRAT